MLIKNKQGYGEIQNAKEEPLLYYQNNKKLCCYV